MGCPYSHMRQIGLIILGIAALTWGVLAIVLDSASLKLFSGSSATAAVSPSCLPGTLDPTARLPGTGVDVSPAPETATASPHTQVSFLGVTTAELHGVSVVGEPRSRAAQVAETQPVSGEGC